MNKLVIFGCDGALVDSEIIASRVVPNIWSKYGVHFSESEFIENISGQGYGSQYFQDVLKRLPENINDITSKALSAIFDEQLQLVEGIQALLDHLMSQFCVISDKSLEYTKKVLAVTQVKKYFNPTVYCSESVDGCLPSLNTYELAVRDNNVMKSNCIAVEASPCCIQAAKFAGIKVVAFAGASHFNPNLKNKLKAEKPDFFCEDISELYEVLLDEF